MSRRKLFAVLVATVLLLLAGAVAVGSGRPGTTSAIPDPLCATCARGG